MFIDTPFTKDNVEYYLKELAKEFKKKGHKAPAEMILVGGASILINYEFRLSSMDIDAVYNARTIMKEAINAVGDRLGLPNGWINEEFTKTESYTPRIVQYSKYYKTFSGVLQVRTVRAEYLVAMKLVSGRRYKKDLSDIAGILYEQKLSGNPLSYEMIDKAVRDLYDNWDRISDYAKKVLNKMLVCEDLQQIFIELSEEETVAKEALIETEQNYPDTVKADNVDEVLAAVLRKKKLKEIGES